MTTAGVIKRKYYAKQILQYILLGGAVLIAASSPSFSWALMRRLFRDKKRVFDKKKIQNSFWYLKKQGFIEMKRDGHDVRIALTKQGKEKAGKYQIDDLEIAHPKQWDGKWRVIIFDIPTRSNVVRNVFRRKLKEFGFYNLQKSIWVFPFPCKEEIGLLRDFLGATKRQIQVLEVSKMEEDEFLRRAFNLSYSNK